MLHTTKTDILIIGGGIAGCIAAISLAEHFSVTLVDKLVTPVDRVGESLAPAAQRILKKLGILDALSKTDIQELFQENTGMQSYWGSDRVQFVDHLRNPDGCSLSLNRKKFASYLREFSKKKGVSCLWGYKLYQSNFLDKTWHVSFVSDTSKERKETTIKAKFVIDATGRNSHFARAIGIQRTHFDKLMSCWISFPNTSVNTMSTIVAEQFGWWYSAVIPEQKRVLSFQTDSDLLERSNFKSLSNFLALVQKSPIIQQLISNTDMNDITFHGTVSANSTRLEKVAGEQWIAIGDAAISFDPLSSQGMFNAMATAIQASELLQSVNFIREESSEKTTLFVKTYTNQIETIWSHYLKHRTLFYGAESRWKEDSFWKRRRV
ncbi:tryptophan 7-halogenase [Tenacibaculum amylolyticum]|uniref:tryptophan 7-halogenase n=1 Tax=Tenacibaculum amylolyticum TaxID=104269 RepID=UPI00389541DE